MDGEVDKGDEAPGLSTSRADEIVGAVAQILEDAFEASPERAKAVAHLVISEIAQLSLGTRLRGE